jgi:hypothetical protein
MYPSIAEDVQDINLLEVTSSHAVRPSLASVYSTKESNFVGATPTKNAYSGATAKSSASKDVMSINQLCDGKDDVDGYLNPVLFTTETKSSSGDNPWYDVSRSNQLEIVHEENSSNHTDESAPITSPSEPGTSASRSPSPISSEAKAAIPTPTPIPKQKEFRTIQYAPRKSIARPVTQILWRANDSSYRHHDHVTHHSSWPVSNEITTSTNATVVPSDNDHNDNPNAANTAFPSLETFVTFKDFTQLIANRRKVADLQAMSKSDVKRERAFYAIVSLSGIFGCLVVCLIPLNADLIGQSSGEAIAAIDFYKGFIPQRYNFHLHKHSAQDFFL